MEDYLKEPVETQPKLPTQTKPLLVKIPKQSPFTFHLWAVRVWLNVSQDPKEPFFPGPLG